MLNIVIPMAGMGSRFSVMGYLDPKPLIPIHGKPMIQLVIENLTPKRPHQFVFVCQKQHLIDYKLSDRLNEWAPHCKVIALDTVTSGAACTVLTAKEIINSENPLMIANSDQYIDLNIDDYLNVIFNENMDGLIMTMKDEDPKWSFVELNSMGWVGRVVEKEVVSNDATVGIYNFLHGRDFVHAALQMIEEDLRTNGEFYVAPTYNHLIKQGKKIGMYGIGHVGNGMYGLGTPADLNQFLNHPISARVAASKDANIKS